jgi:hypothetical protein
MSSKIFTKFKHLKDETDQDSLKPEIGKSVKESTDSVGCLSINDILSEDPISLDKIVFKMDTGCQEKCQEKCKENDRIKYVKLRVKKYKINSLH